MLGINPYLHFPGNAEKAMNFYRSVFGGEFSIFQRYGDISGAEKMTADDREKIIHISLPLVNGHTIMATDMLDSMMGLPFEAGNNFHICVHAESEKEADRLFTHLSAGGAVLMPMNKTLWGAYFGMCRDAFNIQWMINYDVPK